MTYCYFAQRVQKTTEKDNKFRAFIKEWEEKYFLTVEGTIFLRVISGYTVFSFRVSSLKRYFTSEHEGAYASVGIYSDKRCR
jgi:hypothetical protein